MTFVTRDESNYSTGFQFNSKLLLLSEAALEALGVQDTWEVAPWRVPVTVPWCWGGEVGAWFSSLLVVAWSSACDDGRRMH